MVREQEGDFCVQVLVGVAQLTDERIPLRARRPLDGGVNVRDSVFGISSIRTAVPSRGSNHQALITLPDNFS